MGFFNKLLLQIDKNKEKDADQTNKSKKIKTPKEDANQENDAPKGDESSIKLFF